MRGTYADNAVTAKIKALYGQRLTEEDYRQLLQKRSVGEVAAYLKQETCYRDVLAEIKEDLVHRGQLENLIGRHRVDLFGRLLRHRFTDSFFPKITAARYEVEQLLAAMRMLNAGRMDRFVVSFPAHMDPYLSFDLFALARIRSFDDLLGALRHSDYYRQLGPHRPTQGSPIDVPACEATLLTHYYQNALAMVKRQYKGKARDTLVAMLSSEIDRHNLTVLYRIKLFPSIPGEGEKKYLIPIKTRVSTSMIRELAEEEDADGVLARMKNVRILRRYFRGSTDRELERAVGEIRQQTSRKFFRFSVHPVAILMSYRELLEIEGSNLIHIIEGIRYGLPADQVRELLILS